MGTKGVSATRMQTMVCLAFTKMDQALVGMIQRPNAKGDLKKRRKNLTGEVSHMINSYIIFVNFSCFIFFSKSSSNYVREEDEENYLENIEDRKQQEKSAHYIDNKGNIFP